MFHSTASLLPAPAEPTTGHRVVLSTWSLAEPVAWTLLVESDVGGSLGPSLARKRVPGEGPVQSTAGTTTNKAGRPRPTEASPARVCVPKMSLPHIGDDVELVEFLVWHNPYRVTTSTVKQSTGGTRRPFPRISLRFCMPRGERGCTTDLAG